MALTDEERRMLEQLEAQLVNDDPSFAQALASDDAQSSVPASFALSPKHLVLGLIVAVVGLGIVLTGVAIGVVSLGIAGAVVVFLGFLYIFSGSGKEKVSANVPARKPAPQKESFMERQARDWEARKNRRE